MNFQDLRRGMIVLQNTLGKMRRSRELSSVNTSAQKTMMWTGTYMKFAQLGDNPYAKHDGNRETVKDIEPMFDNTNDTLSKEILDKGLIYTVDQMREYLSNQLDSIMAYMTDVERIVKLEENLDANDLIHTNMCLFNIYTNLTETRMWLGMELGRIREEGENAPEARL